jgi:hypothetical protein
MSSQGDEGVLTEMKARERQATRRKFKRNRDLSVSTQKFDFLILLQFHV